MCGCFAARVGHDYPNAQAVIVASHPDGPRYRSGVTPTMLAYGEGATTAPSAASASRRAIADLLDHGRTPTARTEILAIRPRPGYG